MSDLIETPSASYLQRTEWNVRDTDATVIFTIASMLTGGSKRTAKFAENHYQVSGTFIAFLPTCQTSKEAISVLTDLNFS